MGRLDEAAAAAKRALDAEPGPAHELLASIALAAGRLDEAEREASLVTSDAGARARAGVVLAEVMARRGRPAEALSLLDQRSRDNAAQALGPVPYLEFVRGDVLARLEPPRGGGGRLPGGDRGLPDPRPGLREPRHRRRRCRDGLSRRVASCSSGCTGPGPGRGPRCSPRRRSISSVTPPAPRPGAGARGASGKEKERCPNDGWSPPWPCSSFRLETRPRGATAARPPDPTHSQGDAGVLLGDHRRGPARLRDRQERALGRGTEAGGLRRRGRGQAGRDRRLPEHRRRRPRGRRRRSRTLPPHAGTSCSSSTSRSRASTAWCARAGRPWSS